MSAKEMFEELNYYQITGMKKMPIIYQNTTPAYKTTIEFNEYADTLKIIKFDTVMNNYKEITRISLEELQAINKQVEELGWNNER